MQILIGFVLGFIVATVGLSNFTNFAERQLDTARVIVKENVK